jgi:regulator of protease activity HflC (stomatin/prohibitin superfamily)
VHSLKEEAVPIPNQQVLFRLVAVSISINSIFDVYYAQAITRDNVTISIDGVLYVKIVDPYSASYGVEDAMFAISQLAQTTMRSELGKITLVIVMKCCVRKTYPLHRNCRL